jgi:hypothetical protein
MAGRIASWLAHYLGRLCRENAYLRRLDIFEVLRFSAYGAAFGHYQLLAFAVMLRG